MKPLSSHPALPHAFFDDAYDQKLRRAEYGLFFKQFLKHPAQLGTLFPITKKLADAMAFHLDATSCVVELGAGTGKLTRSLLKHSVSPENLTVVELDTDFCDYLKTTLPKVLGGSISPNVICNDAFQLSKIVPKNMIGRVDAVVSAIPLMCFSENKRAEMIQNCFDVMAPGASIYQITYGTKCPVHFMKSVRQVRISALYVNFPPAYIWKITKE